MGSIIFAQKLTGNWTGKGKQTDGQTWDIDLTFEKNDKINISYPSLGCSGNWTYEASIVFNPSTGKLVHDHDNSFYRETIVIGTDKCDQNGEIHLKQIDKKSLKLTYYLRSYDPKNPIAEGTVYKQKKKKK